MRVSLFGGCHCGRIAVQFETSSAIEALPVRADQCGFCRKHGARTTSDSNGRLQITLDSSEDVIRYRFALRTADFLVCARCGVYVAAVMADERGTYATLNINVLDSLASFGMAEPVSYDGEDEAQRRARRAARWTPTVVRMRTMGPDGTADPVGPGH